MSKGCTHGCSQDNKDVCVGTSGLLLSIKLLPELPEHLSASQRLGGHPLPDLLPLTLLWLHAAHIVWTNCNGHPCVAKKKKHDSMS